MSILRTLINLCLAIVLAFPLAVAEYGPNIEEYTKTNPVVLKWSPTPQAKLFSSPNQINLDKSSAPITSLVCHNLAVKYQNHSTNNRWERIIKNIADEHGVSAALVQAVIRAESNFNPRAISNRGAIGLMQVMPSTARRHGVSNPFDPQSNIIAGVRYLRSLLDMFQNDETLALAAYNSGPSQVKKYGGIPPFPETRIFVNRVMAYYWFYL